MSTFHPTTAAELHAAITDPDGPSTIDCDVLKEDHKLVSAGISPVDLRPDLEVIGRGLRLWTHAPNAPYALGYTGPEGAKDCRIDLHNLEWRTNAEHGARIRNATSFSATGVEFQGCDISWAFGAEGDGQCEQINLDNCGGTQAKYTSLLFEGGCSFNSTRIDAFKFHHHQNPDEGDTAYAMQVFGNLYGSKIDVYGWQDDKEGEDDHNLFTGNKGIKVYRSGSVSRSEVNLDAENGGTYLMKIEVPAISFPWELPAHDRRLVGLDFDSITLSGTWRYAYGLILDLMPDDLALEHWIDLSRVHVNGGGMDKIGNEKNRIVGLRESNRTQIVYPAGVNAGGILR